MTFKDTAWNVLSKTQVQAKTTAEPAPPTMVRFTENVYETFPTPGALEYEDGLRIKWGKGQVVAQDDIDAAFAAATLSSIAPATGPAAGGTSVTLTGTNLEGATGVTVGGAAATAVEVVNNETITFTTPAGTVGAQDVVVTDDSGTYTMTGAFTYA